MMEYELSDSFGVGAWRRECGDRALTSMFASIGSISLPDPR